MSALTTQAQALVEFGKQTNEPSWFTQKRTQALEKAQEQANASSKPLN